MKMKRIKRESVSVAGGFSRFAAFATYLRALLGAVAVGAKIAT